MKKKIKHCMIIITGAFLIGIAILCYMNWYQPVKYAVRKNDIAKHPNSILVMETWHTGTGWKKVGDQFSIFEVTERYDIYLYNNTPPLAAIGGNRVNTLLCLVEYTGKDYIEDFSGEYEKYNVIEWYPVYPVLRNTILPSWLYPKGYMTKTDLVNYADR